MLTGLKGEETLEKGIIIVSPSCIVPRKATEFKGEKPKSCDQ